MFCGREHEGKPHVPAVRSVGVIEFLVALDVEIALGCVADRNDEPDLRPDAKHAGLEATDSVARATVATDLVIGVSDQPDQELFGRNCDAAQSKCMSTPF